MFIRMTEDKKQAETLAPVTFDEFSAPDYAQWKAEAEAALKGAPFDKKMFTSTYEGIRLEPIYTAEHTAALGDGASFPGESPFLRGTKPAGGLWKIAQACDQADPADAAKALRQELAKGATTIHPVLDQASLHGRDLPEEEGRGVALSSLADLEILFEGLDLRSADLHMAAGVSSVPQLAMIAAWAGRRGLPASELTGCVGADPLAALAREGELPRPLDELYDEMARTILWCGAEGCPLKTVLIRGDVYGAGGASAVQENACALASAVEILRAMGRRGIDPDAACRRIRFSVALGANFFMEIARLRALRVLWSKVTRAFGCDERSGKIDVFARTSSFTATVYDPYVNILRSATQAFSGVVGGVDGMQVGCFDEAVRPSTEQARRIARNQQVMLQTEFDLASPVDPAGGSWYVETLTRQAEEKSWELFQKIESAGGMAAALKARLVQEDIGAVLQERFKKLATRSDRAVGSNMYPNITEKPLELEPQDRSAFIAARESLVKARRAAADSEAVTAALKRMEACSAERDGSFLNAAADAFAAGAQLSDLWQALNDGAHTEGGARPLPPHRWTEQFEAMRKRTEDFMAEKGENLKIFLANMGPIPQHKARADFSTGFFEVAHFEVLKNDGYASVEEAAAAALSSGADAAVICSTDDTYPELVPPLARAIKAGRPEMTVFLAGAPAPELKQSYLDAGVDDFIHVRANCLQILTAMQKKKGLC